MRTKFLAFFFFISSSFHFSRKELCWSNKSLRITLITVQNIPKKGILLSNEREREREREWMKGRVNLTIIKLQKEWRRSEISKMNAHILCQSIKFILVVYVCAMEFHLDVFFFSLVQHHLGSVFFFGMWRMTTINCSNTIFVYLHFEYGFHFSWTRFIYYSRSIEHQLMVALWSNCRAMLFPYTHTHTNWNGIYFVHQ